MRRLKDTPPGHFELLQLSHSQLLFVQRWMELYDWAADIHFQDRSVTLTEAETELHKAEGFHKPLLAAEVAQLRVEPIFTPGLVDADPILAAERLAARASATCHHPLYLFHAIKLLLDTTTPRFHDRLERLEQFWNTTTEIDFVIYWRITKLKALPSKRAEARLQLVPKDGTPDDVRLVAPKWFAAAPEPDAAVRSPAIMKATVRARDPNAAVESAMRNYYDFRACVRAASPTLDPSEIDLSAAVMHIPSKVDAPYLLSIQQRRFYMRGGKDIALFERIDAAMSAAAPIATFVRNFAEAIEHLREGDIDSALEALILNQDLAFQGCDTRNWRPPRYLVEIGSRLVALDWPRRYFEYIERYVRQTSHTVEPLPGVRDKKQARVLLLGRDAWGFITDDRLWAQMISRAAWDSLLVVRRNDFVRSVSDLQETVRRVQIGAAWDLGRAVRARNSLVHQGSYLRHHRALGVLLDTYELVIHLWLMACERRPPDPQAAFNELVREVERDFDDVISGTFSRQTRRSLCEDGWNAMWSVGVANA